MQTLSAAARTQSARLRLKKSRRLATALLLAAAALFCLSAAFLHRYPQLAYLKAFSEAAMIGWPTGLPLPPFSDGPSDCPSPTPPSCRATKTALPTNSAASSNTTSCANGRSPCAFTAPHRRKNYCAAWPTAPSAASGCPLYAPACPTCCKPCRPNRPPALPPNCWPNNTTAAKSAARWPTAWNC